MAKAEKQDKSIYEKAVKQAKREFEKERVNEIKVMVKDTLEAIEDEHDVLTKAQKRLKLLKADLKDLELGRINLIKERQEKDDLAKKTSKIKMNEIEDLLKGFRMNDATLTYTPAQSPVWIDSAGTPPGSHIIYGNSTTSNSFDPDEKIGGVYSSNVPSTNESVSCFFSQATSGTYELNNGKTKYIGGYK